MDKNEILKQVAEGKLTPDDASELLSEAEAPKRGLYCKVSPKGALSVYGLQRMPVTLYAEQWERLLDFAESVKQFLKENDAQLNRKSRGD